MKNLFNCIWVFSLVAFLMAYDHPGQKQLPTSLKVMVKDQLGNPVEKVAVSLFKTENDYRSEMNRVVPTDSTNAEGAVVFSGLEPVPYYVQAVKGEATNIVSEVLTAPLLEGRINKVSTAIE